MNSESSTTIISESQEIAIGENIGIIQYISKAFPALESRNYQLYFSGQLVSQIGTWLQIVAQGWLVLQLTNSAFLIGLVATVSTLPSLLFALFGGVIVDRFDKRLILIGTQSAAMVLAFILGLLTVMHIVTVPEILVLSALLGTVTAIDVPARQAYAIELVEKSALTSAIALNTGVYNAARVIGPAIAGLLIALVGTGGAFILNGISYIAVIIALLFITTKSRISEVTVHPIRAIKEGLVYSFSHERIRMLLIFAAVVSIFGWSYTTIMPIITKDIFHLGAGGLGDFFAAGGLGALVGTFILSAFGHKRSENFFIIGGTFLFGISILLFTLTASIPFALMLLFSANLGLILEFATINTALHHMVDNTMRGRVMSIYTLVFLGLAPIGNFEVGFLGDRFDSRIAIQIGTLIVLCFGIYFYFSEKRKDLRK